MTYAMRRLSRGAHLLRLQTAAGVVLLSLPICKTAESDNVPSSSARKAGEAIVSSALHRKFGFNPRNEATKRGIEWMLEIYFGGSIKEGATSLEIYDQALKAKVMDYVTAYGFSEKVGIWSVDLSIASDQMKNIVVEEVRSVCMASQRRARLIIEQNQMVPLTHGRPERPNRPTDVHRTAVHESGHALVCLYTLSGDLEIVSVRPNVSHGGYTRNKRDLSQSTFTKEEMLDSIDMALAGRAAEEVVFGTNNVGTGAWGDIEQVTDYAYEILVCDPPYTMKQRLDRSYCYERIRLMSEIEKQNLERSIQELIQYRYQRVLAFLTERYVELDNLARTLQECETLSGAEVVTWLETGVKPNVEKGSYRQRYSSGHLKKKKLMLQQQGRSAVEE